MRQAIAKLLLLSLLLAERAFSAPLVVSLRFDPGYLYASEYAGLGKSFAEKSDRAALQDALIQHWQRMAVKRVYILVTNPVYGLNLPLNSAYPQEQGLGQTPFLSELMEKMESAGIEPWAWLYFLQSKHAWEKNPDWRATHERKVESDIYLLRAGSSDALAWQEELILGLLKKYPRLRGVDLAEPMEFTAKGQKPSLTPALRRVIEKIRSSGSKVSLTPLVQVDKKGNLLPAKSLLERTGFDWDWFTKTYTDLEFYPQLQFQEWRQDPLWSRKTYKELRRRHGDAFALGVHLEFASFSVGVPFVSPVLLGSAVMDLSKEKNLAGIDLYDSHLAWQMFGPPAGVQKLPESATKVRNSP